MNPSSSKDWRVIERFIWFPTFLNGVGCWLTREKIMQVAVPIFVWDPQLHFDKDKPEFANTPEFWISMTYITCVGFRWSEVSFVKKES